MEDLRLPVQQGFWVGCPFWKFSAHVVFGTQVESLGFGGGGSVWQHLKAALQCCAMHVRVAVYQGGSDSRNISKTTSRNP